MSSLINAFFKPPTPEQQVKKWQQSLRSQARQLDRQIRNIDVEEQKVKKALKEAGKKGNKVICQSLAKELIRSRKAKERIHTSKAQLNSVGMQLSHQLANIKLAGSLKKSTEVIHLVNNLVKLPVIHLQMQEMAREMMKAGIIEEMLDDSLEALDPEGIDEEAEDEVEKILFEVTDGLLGQAGKVGSELEGKDENESNTVEEDPDLLARLNSLKIAG